MAEHSDSSSGRYFWLSWVFASSAGMAAGLALTFLILNAIDLFLVINQDRFLAYIMLPSIGTSIGFAQWLVLRRRITQARWWILASVVGYSVCLVTLLVFDDLRLPSEKLWPDALLLLLTGVVVGVPQWIVLRRYDPRAGWWVLASGLGLLGQLVVVANPASTPVGFIGYLAFEGAFLGAVTGFLLVRLLGGRPMREGALLRQGAN